MMRIAFKAHLACLAGAVFWSASISTASAHELVSVSSGGVQGNDDSFCYGSPSATGRYVVFHSYASNLVLDDTNGSADVFLRDRRQGITNRLSLGQGGKQANATSLDGVLAADGRTVAFTSFASNLVRPDTNDESDIFVRDLETGATERVSVATDGTQADSGSFHPRISPDGRYVVFQSTASNLVANDSNGLTDV